MSKQKSFAKSPILPDGDEQLDPQDLNPFSFREFLRSKNQDQDQDPEQDLSQVVQLQSAAEEKDEDEGGHDMSLTYDPEEEAEDRWGRSLKSGVAGMSFFCTEEEETRFSCKPEDQQGGGAAVVEATGRWAREGAAGGAEEGEVGGAAGCDETSIAGAVTSCSRSQIQKMEEENLSLRRSMREFQRRSDANERRVLELSEELVQRRRQEEKEAQDLESMVQSVEQNLRLMTKRALKAESCVSKLKVEVDSLQSENDSLKAAESEIVMTMRNNAQVASEYLNKTASHAHSSIRQLLGETETLCLVSQLLKSIDKISELDSES